MWRQLVVMAGFLCLLEALGGVDLNCDPDRNLVCGAINGKIYTVLDVMQLSDLYSRRCEVQALSPWTDVRDQDGTVYRMKTVKSGGRQFVISVHRPSSDTIAYAASY